jgi:hypothetical protein
MHQLQTLRKILICMHVVHRCPNFKAILSYTIQKSIEGDTTAGRDC